jgi:hypothetical protein
MPKTNITPEIGKIYLGRRYHNSKRIVWEPFRVESENISTVAFYRYRGTWLLDNSPGSAGSFKDYDPKWTARKVCDLEREVKMLQDQINQLKSIQA